MRVLLAHGTADKHSNTALSSQLDDYDRSLVRLSERNVASDGGNAKALLEDIAPYLDGDSDTDQEGQASLTLQLPDMAINRE